MGWSPRLLPSPCYHFTALPEFQQSVCKTQKGSPSPSPPLVKVQEKGSTNPHCTFFIPTVHHRLTEHCRNFFLPFEFQCPTNPGLRQKLGVEIELSRPRSLGGSDCITQQHSRRENCGRRHLLYWEIFVECRVLSIEDLQAWGQREQKQQESEAGIGVACFCCFGLVFQKDSYTQST